MFIEEKGENLNWLVALNNNVDYVSVVLFAL